MVVTANPFCPVSFGLVGFLGAILSRRSFLYGNSPDIADRHDDDDEHEDLLLGSDPECDVLSEDRITHYLETQKQEYYKSIGLAPPLQRSMDVSTTPGTSMVDLTSSRETSYIDEDETEESSLLAVLPTSAPATPEYVPRTYHMSDSSDDEQPPPSSLMDSISQS